MIETITIDCPHCGDGAITVDHDPGKEAATYYPDGSGHPNCPATVHVVNQTCTCRIDEARVLEVVEDELDTQAEWYGVDAWEEMQAEKADHWNLMYSDMCAEAERRRHENAARIRDLKAERDALQKRLAGMEYWWGRRLYGDVIFPHQSREHAEEDDRWDAQLVRRPVGPWEIVKSEEADEL